MQKHLQQKSHSPGNKGQSVPTLMRHYETNFVFLDKFDNQDEKEINWEKGLCLEREESHL